MSDGRQYRCHLTRDLSMALTAWFAHWRPKPRAPHRGAHQRRQIGGTRLDGGQRREGSRRHRGRPSHKTRSLASTAWTRIQREASD